LYITLVVRERRLGWHFVGRVAISRGEVLQIAGNELKLAAMIVD
jgi:hypothetical protein